MCFLGDDTVDQSTIKSAENNPFSSPAKIVAYRGSDSSESGCTTEHEEDTKDVLPNEVLLENHDQSTNPLTNQLNHNANANERIGPQVSSWSGWYGYDHHRAPHRSFVPATHYNNPCPRWLPWNQWNPWNPRAPFPMQNRPLLGARPGAPPHSWGLPVPHMFSHGGQPPRFPPGPTAWNGRPQALPVTVKAKTNEEKSEKMENIGLSVEYR